MIATTAYPVAEAAAEGVRATRTRHPLPVRVLGVCARCRWLAVALALGLALGSPIWRMPEVLVNEGIGASGPVSLWTLLCYFLSPSPAAARSAGLLVVVEAALAAAVLLSWRFAVPAGLDQNEVLRAASHDLRVERPAAPGSRLGNLLGGRYELVRQIGSGAMGIVFEGRDHSLDRPVAIKRMRTNPDLGTLDREQFLREAKTTALLNHPFLVDIYDVLDEGSDIYLVFEYVDGESLDDYLFSEGRLPADKTLAVLKPVCEALSFVHERKIAHRDVKPSNIMLSRTGYAKLVDLGIARAMEETIARPGETEATGTYAYMAPEQEFGGSDARSDVFALGVTAYELLTGELPFRGPNFYLQKEKGVYRPLKEAAPQAPATLVAAIERCLRFDPSERFASVAEFAAAAGMVQATNL